MLKGSSYIYFHTFLDTLHKRGYAENTILAYKNALDRWGDGDPQDPEAYFSYLNDLAGSNLSFSSRNVCISAIMGAVHFMVLNDFAIFSPVQMAKMEELAKFVRGKPKKSKKIEDYTPLVGKILKRAREIADTTHGNRTKAKKKALRNAAMLEILATSGIRISELVALTLETVDLEANRLLIYDSKGENRVVYFKSDSFLEYLKRHDDLRLFPVTTNAVRAMINKLAAECGIEKFTPHMFRHAFATELLSKTGNLALVQNLMGHADPKTTRIYAQILDQDAKDEWGKVFDK